VLNRFIVGGIALPAGGSAYNLSFWEPGSDMSQPVTICPGDPASILMATEPEIGPVLLVEDDPEIRLVLAECLEDNGFRVVEMASAEAAEVAMKDGITPSVVITDINLGPGENGLSLADKVHVAYPNTAVVFITGRLDMLRDRGLLPAEYVVPKPFPLSTLLTMVRKLGTMSH
jgi:DNA-binding NtrC family response regulator